MPNISLSSGSEFLRDAAQRCFAELYQNPTVYVNKAYSKDLNWTPSLHFAQNRHITVFVEPSESAVCSQILQMRYAEIVHCGEPIAVYSVCPIEVANDDLNRKAVVEMRELGYGLIVVAENGDASRLFPAVPLVQVISRREFKSVIGDLTKSYRQLVAQAYEDYCNRPAVGVSTLTEIVDGMIMKAGEDAVRKGYISKAQLGNTAADILDSLSGLQKCKNARAPIGGVRGYVQRYRNVAHHWPRKKKDSYRKFRECKEAFLEGVRHIEMFSTALKQCDLTGKVRML